MAAQILPFGDVGDEVTGVQGRVCGRCKEVKAAGEFNRGRSKDGLAYVCRECQKQYRLDWIEKNRNRHLSTRGPASGTATKQCQSCKEVKPAPEFERAFLSESADGMTARRLACLGLHREAKRQGKRFCSGCRQAKEPGDFYKSKRKNRSYAGYCKTCDRERWKRKQAEMGPEHRLAETRRRTLRTYGLTEEQYESMLAEQRNLCLICEGQIGTPHIDHCHTTGKFRGLLCHKCNGALGLFQDNIRSLKRAIQYLRKHSPYAFPRAG